MRECWFNNMKDTYNIVELFSGIGSQARALNNIGININVQATCEWDIHAFIAYDAIHYAHNNISEALQLDKPALLEKLKDYSLSNNGKEAMQFNTLRTYDVETLRRVYSAIIRTHNLVDISKVTGEKMPLNTDILTYSFPCQDLSNVGAFHHYNKGIDKNSGSRSSLLWQVGRILSEMQELSRTLPRYLIMENVPTLLSQRHIGNFNTWKQELANLGYVSYEYQLNARNFGIPQNRPRLLMISVYVGDDEQSKRAVSEYLGNLTSDAIVDNYTNSQFFHNRTIEELIRIPADENDPLWQEAVDCTPNDTESRRQIWRENPVIRDEHGVIQDEPFIRTITTKQDRNPNSGNIYFDCGIEGRGCFRYLTPRECFLFMGFEDRDYNNLMANNPPQRVHSLLFPRDKIIRMAGNSIPVKLLEGFFYQLYMLEPMLGY